MEEREYKRHMYKIYSSCILGLFYIVSLFIYLVKSPGKFNEISYSSKLGLILLLVLGVVYVIFITKFLTSSKSVQCLHRYTDKQKNKDRKNI